MSAAADKTCIDKLMSDLRAVLDPEIGLSVVDMGMIRDVQLGEDKAQASLGMPVVVERSQERWDPSMMAPENG